MNILAIGRNEAILQVVERLINGHEGWVAKTALSEEEAVAAVRAQKFEIVLICAGISAGEEEGLRAQLSEIDPVIVIIRHYGGGSGLLENEINQVIWKIK